MEHTPGKIPVKLRAFFVILIVVIVFYFMTRTAILNWNRVPLKELHFKLGYLMFSFSILFFTFFLGAYAWKLVLSKFGENLSFLKSLQIISLTQGGRYIPGKIWALAGQAYLAQKENISFQSAMTTVILMNIGYIIASLLVAFCFGGLYYGQHSVINLFLLIMVLIGGLISIHPYIVNRLIRISEKIFKKEFLNYDIRMTYSDSLKLVFIFIVGCILQGIALFCFINSFYDLSVQSIIPLIGINASAFAIGFLAVIMPAGIGVREGVLSYLLSFYMPPSIAVISSILARVWITIGELVLFLIFAKNLKRYI